MARSTMTGLVRAGALAVACLGVLPGAATAGYTSLFVFGDSLSDPGNLFALAGQPGSPYVDGRFSNGPVAAEYLANRMQLGPGQVFNFAHGGAETGLNGALGSPTGLTSQVNAFTGMLAGGPADPTGLYMVWAGPNDLLSLFSGPPPSDAQINATVAQAVGNLAGAVGTLYQAGARDFLLPLLPDLGATPRLNGTPLAAAASALSASFNMALIGAYDMLGANPLVQGEQFFVFNTPAAQAAAASALVLAGGNATDACLGNAPAPSCTGFFFFDDIHPTTAAHAVLAEGLATAAQVPEPGSLLLAATAVAALVSASNRRRRQRAGL